MGLSVPQRRALAALARRPDDWHKPMGVSASTLYALERRGLVHVREMPTTPVACPTELGRSVAWAYMVASKQGGGTC